MPSQAGQSSWVLSTLGQNYEGYFVDIGAWDGIEYSNTLEFERDYHWKGVCIEPVQYHELVTNRQCRCVRAWCSHGEYEQHILTDGQCSRVSNMPGSQKVQTRTLTSVLLEVDAPRVIDYLSLDVEGSERNVLAGLNFEWFRFRTITMEVDKPNSSDAIQYLVRKGYCPVQEFRIGDYLLDLGFVPTFG